MHVISIINREISEDIAFKITVKEFKKYNYTIVINFDRLCQLRTCILKAC